MTMPAEALLLAFAVITLAAARALAPQAPDARDGEPEDSQHREGAPPANLPGAEGARFDLYLGLIAALFALWFLLSGLAV
jgi:hypothetical protein